MSCARAASDDHATDRARDARGAVARNPDRGVDAAGVVGVGKRAARGRCVAAVAAVGALARGECVFGAWIAHRLACQRLQRTRAAGLREEVSTKGGGAGLAGASYLYTHINPAACVSAECTALQKACEAAGGQS